MGERSGASAMISACQRRSSVRRNAWPARDKASARVEGLRGAMLGPHSFCTGLSAWVCSGCWWAFPRFPIRLLINDDKKKSARVCKKNGRGLEKKKKKKKKS